MKNNKTSINVNIIPGIIACILIAEILLLAVLIFLPVLRDSSLEEARNIRIIVAISMVIVLLIQLFSMKMANFDDNGITFYKWICFKKKGTISYSDIEKITLITAHLNTVGYGRSQYADFITIYLDADREKITENIENVPNGLYWQIVATKHNFEVFDRYRTRYFPDIEIEDHRQKKGLECLKEPYYRTITKKKDKGKNNKK